jgi:hypothetical protein
MRNRLQILLNQSHLGNLNLITKSKYKADCLTQQHLSKKVGTPERIRISRRDSNESHDWPEMTELGAAPLARILVLGILGSVKEGSTQKL